MEHLADERIEVGSNWIEETATQTLRGLFDAANELIEEAVAWLGSVWSDVRSGARPTPPSPVARWVFRAPPDPGFVGFAPSSHPDELAAIVVHPRTAERIKLAEQVRQLG
jgi:hypothetical protein